MRQSHARSIVLCGLLLGVGWRAHAQDASAPEPPPTAASQGRVEPPVVLEPVEPVVPEALRSQQGLVVLRVLVDVDGSVRAAEVAESLEPTLDAAAVEAALRTRFSPARRDGQALAARILMRFEFPRPEPEPAPLPTAAPANVASAWPSGPNAASLEEPLTPVPAPSPAAAAPAALEVQVSGQRSDEQKLRESAEAVTVIHLTDDHHRSADMGDVMARTAGVVVRRAGGLGSYERFSLNGLYDEQIRFFMDGIPLEFAGLPFGMSNIPVGVIQRIEIYRGVVPVRFGTDALGGAVNFITDDRKDDFANVGLEMGSYGMRRLAASGRLIDDATGLIVLGHAYFDVADNDYDVDVEVTDDRGRLSPATVPRFHDWYRAFGGALEAGVVDKPWAKRLTLRGFYGRYDKELQHNLVMSVPYGEVQYAETISGLTLRYEQPLARNLDLELVGNYGYRTIWFLDDSDWVYDWYGEQVRERRKPGEIDGDATDLKQWQHGAYARLNLNYRPHPLHALRLSAAPTYVTRTGDERLQLDPDARDPENAVRSLMTLVGGLEWEWNAWAMPDVSPELQEREPDRSHRLQNILMAKVYFYRADSDEIVPGGALRQRDVSTNMLGAGDALRVRLTRWLMLKASYEFTLRFPRPDEVFGDGRLVQPNLELEPEISHNVNVGPRVELERSAIGGLIFDTSAFLREVDQMIVMLGNERFFRYQNVFAARALGVQAELEWIAPGRYLHVKGSTSYESTRNTSDDGPFADFEGDRIPNRPYFLASYELKGRIPKLFDEHDALEPFYQGRYVHEFFRGWESQGLREFKQVIRSQFVQAVGIDYGVEVDRLDLWLSLEVDNLFDALAYDLYGVQRPGRAFYAKLFGQFE